MQYIVWRLQRCCGLLAKMILYPIKALVFIPVVIDMGIDRILCRIRR